MSRCPSFAALLGMLLLAGCAGAHKPEGLRPIASGGRVVLMPPSVQLSELTAGRTLEPRADWTTNAEKHVMAALSQPLRAKNGALVPYREPSADSDKQQLHLPRL